MADICEVSVADVCEVSVADFEVPTIPPSPGLPNIASAPPAEAAVEPTFRSSFGRAIAYVARHPFAIVMWLLLVCIVTAAVALAFSGRISRSDAAGTFERVVSMRDAIRPLK